MPRRKHLKLPSRAGYCSPCGKDLYPDTISAQLALEFFRRYPHRGVDSPIRFYPCPRHPGRYHLTSQLKGVENREIQYSG